MRDLNMAPNRSERSSRCSVRPPFDERLSQQRTSPARAALRSQQLKTAFRSPTAGIPFQALPRQGRSSWPIPSLLRPDFSRPVDFELPSSKALQPPGRIAVQNPLPGSSRSLRPARYLFAPRRGFYSPSARSAQNSSLAQDLPFGIPDFPSLPDFGQLLVNQNRITVPGSLHPVRLAVP